MPDVTSGRVITSSISSGSFDDVRRPISRRSIICRASVSRSCSFQPELGRRDQSVAQRRKTGVAMTMPAPLEGDGISGPVYGGKMRVGRDTRLAQDRSGEQPAEPGRVLQDLQLVPSVECNDRPQHRRQTIGLFERGAPFVEPFVLVPSRS